MILPEVTLEFVMTGYAILVLAGRQNPHTARIYLLLILCQL